MAPCLHCQRASLRLLPHSSAGAHVHYYRCEECGHVFHVPHDAPNGPRTDVTAPAGALSVATLRRIPDARPGDAHNESVGLAG